MSEISKIMERVTKTLKKGFEKSLSILGWMAVILQNLGTA
jgi:hypothetical protein